VTEFETCEDAGHLTLYDVDECEEAGQALGYTWDSSSAGEDWPPPGCSAEPGTNEFWPNGGGLEGNLCGSAFQCVCIAGASSPPSPPALPPSAPPSAPPLLIMIKKLLKTGIVAAVAVAAAKQLSTISDAAAPSSPPWSHPTAPAAPP